MEMRDEDGADVVEAYTICGMGHGVPLVPAQDGGQAGAFHFDVGVSSSLQILKFWGLAAAHAAVLEDTTDAEAVSPALDLPLVGAMTATAARRHSRELGSASLGHGANSEGPTTDNTPFDPRDVITASLQKAGLLVPPGSRPASDPRSIITTTLRSVGLLKE